MKRAFITVLVLLGLMSCESPKPSSKIPQNNQSEEQTFVFKNVDAKEFNDLINSGKGQLLDVRTQGEVDNGKIAGATHYDFFGNEFQAQISKLDKKQPVYVYCASGNRSGQAMNMMKEMGFTEVYNLSGGIGAWTSEGLPLVK